MTDGAALAWGASVTVDSDDTQDFTEAFDAVTATRRGGGATTRRCARGC